jgi:hypothetical protein
MSISAEYQWRNLQFNYVLLDVQVCRILVYVVCAVHYGIILLYKIHPLICYMVRHQCVDTLELQEKFIM